MKHFLKWNPVVSGAMLGLAIYLGTLGQFRWQSVAAIAGMALWFGLSVARLFSIRARVHTAPIGKRRPLSDEELEARIGKGRLASLSRARFGGVIISERVLSGHRPASMIRVEPEPDPHFSGWVFLAHGDMLEHLDHRKLHDCIEVLRVAPEAASYLDSPVDTHLVRTGEQKFELDQNDNEPSKASPQPHA